MMGRSEAPEPGKHEVGGVELFSVANADPESGKLVGAQVVDDVAQAFLSAVGSPWPQTQLAQRQAEIVADDQQVGQIELVKTATAWPTERPLRFMKVSGFRSRTRR